MNVSFTCPDSLSGVVTCSGPSTLHEGAGQSVTGSASDAAGNTASTTVSGVNVDETAPTLTSAPTSSANANGWYNHAVTIHWTCGDALSGVDTTTCPADASLNAEGVAQQLTRTVLDLAGNATTASSAPVKIDLTAAGDDGVGHPDDVHEHRPVGHAVRRPTTSRVSTRRCSRSTADRSRSGTTVTFTADGVHTLTYWSVDNAGNVESTHVVTVRIDKTAPTITAAQFARPERRGLEHRRT